MTPSDWSDWSEDSNIPVGLANPDYPGFQHLETCLLSDTDSIDGSEREFNRFPIDEYNNNQELTEVNQLDVAINSRKSFYDKSKFNIQVMPFFYTSILYY